MSDNQYLLESKASANKLDPALSDMLNVIALAQPRADNEIPTDAGFCMDGAFFPDVEPVARHYESARLYLTLDGHRDVHIEINIDMNGDKVFESLLTRINKTAVEPEFEALNAMTICFREGAHPVGEILAEERLDSIVAGKTFYNHSFAWESTGKVSDYYAPNIHVSLSSGDNIDGAPVRPSVSDAQAIALFDFVVNSIRLRPFGEAAKRASRVPNAPLGTLIQTCTMCPQAGWWEAIPPSEDGIEDPPQYFAEGASMPEKEIEFLRRFDWMTINFELRMAGSGLEAGGVSKGSKKLSCCVKEFVQFLTGSERLWHGLCQ